MILRSLKWKCPKCRKAVLTEVSDTLGPFVCLHCPHCGHDDYQSKVPHTVVEAPGKGSKTPKKRAKPA